MLPAGPGGCDGSAQKGYGRASTTHTAFYPVRPTYLLGHEAKGNEVNLTSTQIALARLSTLSRWVSQVTSHTQYARNRGFLFSPFPPFLS